jgi:hypothetical protein
VPDDFSYYHKLVSFQYYDLNNYNTGLFTFGNGASRNLAYTVGLSRNNKGVNPIYPTYGSEFSISGKFTFLIHYLMVLIMQFLLIGNNLASNSNRRLYKLFGSILLEKITLLRLKTKEKLIKKDSIG